MNAGGVSKACKLSGCGFQLSAISFRLMNEFRFTRFEVYQEAKCLHRKIVLVTRNFPLEFNYLKNQLRRCSLSTVLNIAEGSGKDSDKDFNRYIQNALGSINETAAGIDVSEMENLISGETKNELWNYALQVKQKLGALSKTLKSR
jgi:four helix bundle protein